MDCFCGCGARLPRGLTDENLQAGRIAVELLAWDKARAAGRLGPPAADDAERVMERGAECYQRLLRSLHGERDAYSTEDGESWLAVAREERRERKYMTRRRGILREDRLILDEEDLDRLDRLHPERSFTGAERRPAAGPSRAGGTDVAGQLERLAAMNAEGVLSDEEFAAAKARVIDPPLR